MRELEKTLKGLPQFLDKVNKAVKQVANLKSRMDTLEFAFESLAREKAKKSSEKWRKQLTSTVFDYKQAREYDKEQMIVWKY